ncbi:UNVERIFIED_CONTAM: hypothetical protein RMT77_006327 [Armadillidium vulgare]
MGAGSKSLEEINLYVKAGVDGERLGACPFCQRVYMVLLYKSQSKLLKFKVVTAKPSLPPPEFKTLGLKHLPAIIHNEEGYDALDDIISYIDGRFPDGSLEYKNNEADLAAKDFFSSFCFYIKAVSQDATKLISSLAELNDYLEKSFLVCTNVPNEDTLFKPRQYLCGQRVCHLDCEVLPKLQHLRVAAKILKNFEIPTHFKGLWRYLYTAYSEEFFVKTCPCDQEIILHWHDRPETTKLSPKMHSVIAKENPKYSFDIPVHASFVTITE